jgi:hypothetical protein
MMVDLLDDTGNILCTIIKKDLLKALKLKMLKIKDRLL